MQPGGPAQPCCAAEAHATAAVPTTHSPNPLPPSTRRPLAIKPTRWKLAPLYPVGTPFRRNSPVHICRKFSAVLGTTSAKSSICIRPAGTPPIATSAAGRQRGVASAAWYCHRTALLLGSCPSGANVGAGLQSRRLGPAQAAPGQALACTQPQSPASVTCRRKRRGWRGWRAGCATAPQP